MKMVDITTRAKECGIRPGRMRKEDIIRQIQKTEGNFDCFGTATDRQCDQIGCCWREDCLK